MKDRRKYLDIAKLLVVLSVVHNHSNIGLTPVTRTINILHMPSFFVIYGIASSTHSAKGKEWMGVVAKRVKSLLVPYVLWALIYGKSYDLNFWKNLLIGNNFSLGWAGTNQVLWFLPCMFFATMLYQIYANLLTHFHKKPAQHVFKLVFALVCSVISCSFKLYPAGLRWFTWDVAFAGCTLMVMGNIVRDGWEWVRGSVPICGKLIFILIGGAATAFLARKNLIVSGLSSATTMAWGEYGVYPLFILGGFIGCLTVMLIAMLLERIELLGYMGHFSLVIMAAHYILYIYVKPWCNGLQHIGYGVYVYPVVVTFLCFVLCIPICILIDWACPELNGKKFDGKSMLK